MSRRYVFRLGLPIVALVCALSVPVPAGAQEASGPPSPVLPDIPGLVAERFDVGGRSLFLVCLGAEDSGLPTVIAEAGLGGDSGSFGALAPLLAAAPFRACAYDRAGHGASDPPAEGDEPGPGPVTARDITNDLHALLGAAGIEPPYVLMAHSLGGWFARVFATDHPDEVAAIILIDSSHPDQWKRFAAVLPPGDPQEDPRITEMREAALGILDEPPVADTGWLDIGASADETRSTGDLGDLPLVVLTAGVYPSNLPEPYASWEYSAWLNLQHELAALSTRAAHCVVPGAGHAIQEDRPDAVASVIEALQAALATGSDEWIDRACDAVDGAAAWTSTPR